MFQSSQFRSFTDQLNEWVQQPVFFAAIASLGLHGIVFAVLPSFSFTTTSDDDQQTVPVVELGANDISRLPSFVDLDTPTVPEISDPYDIGLTPLDGAESGDPLEDLLNNYSADNADLPPSDFFNSLPRPTPLSPPRALPNPVWPFSLPAPSSLPTTPVKPNPDTLPTPNNPTPLSEGTEPSSPEPEDSSNSNASDEPPSARSNPEPESSPPLSPEETQATLTALLEYTGPTDNDGVNKAFDTARDSWKKLVEDRPDIIATDQTFITIPGDYPKFACLLQTDDINVTIAVFVDAANQILANPEPIYILRSWRKWFDDEALKLVQDYEFDNQTGEIMTYAVTVAFDYQTEQCPSIPVTPNPASTSTNPAPTSGNETSPSAQSEAGPELSNENSPNAEPSGTPDSSNPETSQPDAPAGEDSAT